MKRLSPILVVAAAHVVIGADVAILNARTRVVLDVVGDRAD